jgi:hypothetical protein
MNRQAITIHIWKFLHSPPYSTSSSSPLFLLITIPPLLPPSSPFHLYFLPTCIIMRSDPERRTSGEESSSRPRRQPLSASSTPAECYQLGIAYVVSLTSSHYNTSGPADCEFLMARLENCAMMLECSQQLMARMMMKRCKNVCKKLCRYMDGAANQLNVEYLKVRDDRESLEMAWKTFRRETTASGIPRPVIQKGKPRRCHPITVAHEQWL